MKYLITLLLISSLTITSQAQQIGTLDKTYGNNNTGTITATGGNGFTSVMQPDDKLIIGGWGTTEAQFILVRHAKDGSVDTTFGINGQVTTNVKGLVKGFTGAYGWQSITLQPDGKIVATGSVLKFNPNIQGSISADNDIVVARFQDNGTPDESFGTHGILVTDLGKMETPDVIALQKDGKIVIGGHQDETSDGGGSRLLMVRYNTDGNLDLGFGQGKGYITYTKGENKAFALVVQSDGKLVAGGEYNLETYFFVVRYLPDGTIDNEFGTGGAVQTPFGEGHGIQINSLALDVQENIIAAGITSDKEENSQMAVARYVPNGTLDNSFGVNGKIAVGFTGATNCYAHTVLLQPKGKMVISGEIEGGDFLNAALALAGLNASDGSLDSSFGTNGQTVTDLGLSAFGLSANTQTDGKILLAGWYEPKDNSAPYYINRYYGYSTTVPLAVRIKRFIHNHSITWNGLPADDNIAYYSVEQSSLSTKGFTPIAKLSGRSNLRDYSLNNSSLLPATNYYRIKAVSTDGVVRYSEVVSADNIANTASVFPNPAKSYVTVQGLQSNATANISIKDGSGTVLTRGTSSGSTQYRSQVSNLLPGTYYLNITTAGKTETLPFVKE